MILIIIAAIVGFICWSCRKIHYTAPTGEAYNLFLDMLKQPHLLIAGATGSGKSVTLNGLIATALYRLPFESHERGAQFILIDPKKVSLAKYKTLPHTIAYADTHESIIQAMRKAESIMDARYAEMQRKGQADFTGADLYIMIDEVMDLMTTPATKKQFAPVLQRICQLGRAAKVHAVVCTQCPLREVIPTPIKCNIDARLCLRTENDQDSRNIMRRSGAELLPNPRTAGKAQGYYKNGPEITLYNLPRVPQEEIDGLIAWWKDQKRKNHLAA